MRRVGRERVSVEWVERVGRRAQGEGELTVGVVIAVYGRRVRQRSGDTYTQPLLVHVAELGLELPVEVRADLLQAHHIGVLRS